jgi:hypothetical protein
MSRWGLPLGDVGTWDQKGGSDAALIDREVPYDALRAPSP